MIVVERGNPKAEWPLFFLFVLFCQFSNLCLPQNLHSHTTSYDIIMKPLIAILSCLMFGCLMVAASEKYIVVLKPNITSEMTESHLSDVRMHSLVPSNRTSRIGNLHFYSAHLSGTGIQEIEKNHSHVVDYLIKDQTFRVQELIQPNPPNWGLSRIDVHTGDNSLFSFPTSAGSGVDVYVLDTGVYAHHSDLVGRVTSAPSFIGQANDTTDSNGHGTFVAGVCCGEHPIKEQK